MTSGISIEMFREAPRWNAAHVRNLFEKMCSSGRTHDPSLSRRTFLLRNNEYQYQRGATAREREWKRGKSAVFESPAIIDCLCKEEGRFERYPPADRPKEISKRRTYRLNRRSSQRPRRFQRCQRWNRSKGKCKSWSIVWLVAKITRDSRVSFAIRFGCILRVFKIMPSWLSTSWYRWPSSKLNIVTLKNWSYEISWHGFLYISLE